MVRRALLWCVQRMAVEKGNQLYLEELAESAVLFQEHVTAPWMRVAIRDGQSGAMVLLRWNRVE